MREMVEVQGGLTLLSVLCTWNFYHLFQLLAGLVDRVDGQLVVLEGHGHVAAGAPVVNQRHRHSCLVSLVFVWHHLQWCFIRLHPSPGTDAAPNVFFEFLQLVLQLVAWHLWKLIMLNFRSEVLASGGLCILLTRLLVLLFLLAVFIVILDSHVARLLDHWVLRWILVKVSPFRQLLIYLYGCLPAHSLEYQVLISLLRQRLKVPLLASFNLLFRLLGFALKLTCFLLLDFFLVQFDFRSLPMSIIATSLKHVFNLLTFSL